MRSLMVLVVLGVAVGSPGLAAQALPPRPVDSMVADFVADPGNLQMLALATEACPLARGSWQFEFVERLMELPPQPRTENALATFLAAALVGGCEDDLVSSWLRDFAAGQTQGSYLLAQVAGALGRSGAEANRLTALTVLFDPRFDESVRELVFWPWTRGSDTPFQEEIRIIADGIRLVDGRPPAARLSHIIVGVRDEEGYTESGVDALRELLDAVVARPDSPAALPTLNALLSQAPNLSVDDPWFRELGDVSRDIAAGRRPAPPELREFVAARTNRFCRPNAPPCEP